MKLNAPTFLAACLCGASLGLLQPAAGHADSGRSRSSEARELRASGHILPMEDILLRSRQARPGEVMEVELERDNGRYIYEVKIIDDADRVHKLKLDAASGEVLSQKTR